MYYQAIFVILSLTIVQWTYACYITNCPIGGKRSLVLNNELRSPQCPRCGINGQCYGPAICCTNRGCRIGHPSDMRQCSIENHSTVPCSIESPPCSSVPNGRCASNGICCSPKTCQLDETCSISTKQKIFNLQE